MIRFACATTVLFASVATAAEPDALLDWTSTSCGDADIKADAKARVRSMCGSSAPASWTYQYEPSRTKMGCEVWVHAWCGDDAKGPAYAPPGDVTVPTLYMDKDHKGQALAVDVGELNLVDVPVKLNGPGAAGSWSGKASSIKVPSGFTAVVCQEPGGRGRCSEIDGDELDLGRQFVGNDKALWVRVTRGRGTSAYTCPRAYHNDNFGGEYLDLCEDWPDLTGSIWDDKISSVLVPAGWEVELCQNANYGAPCKTLDADEAKLGFTAVGSDRATSIRVVKRP